MIIPDLLPMKEVEKKYVLETFDLCNRNCSKTAKVLEMGRTTLWRRLKEWGVDVKGYWNEEKPKKRRKKGEYKSIGSCNACPLIAQCPGYSNSGAKREYGYGKGNTLCMLRSQYVK